jgi:transcriptional regulator with XRE-family HTH domain
MSFQQQALGSRLRREREQRGVTLDAIAESTKIQKSLLAALERGDVSHWPRGIFRRAYVRDYASAVGLPPEETLAEFLRVFPERPADEDAGVEAPPLASSPLRLTLAADGLPARLRPTGLRARAALADAVLLAGSAAVVAAVTGWPYWTAFALAGLAYYAAGTVWLGCSAATWWLTERAQWVRHAPRSRVRAAGDVLQIVARQGELSRKAAPEPARDVDGFGGDLEDAPASQRLRSAK